METVIDNVCVFVDFSHSFACAKCLSSIWSNPKQVYSEARLILLHGVDFQERALRTATFVSEVMFTTTGT